jgi:hypothetical protein
MALLAFTLILTLIWSETAFLITSFKAQGFQHQEEHYLYFRQWAPSAALNLLLGEADPPEEGQLSLEGLDTMNPFVYRLVIEEGQGVWVYHLTLQDGNEQWPSLSLLAIQSTEGTVLIFQ